MVSGRRSPLRPRAANSARTANGQAVNFIADAIPGTTPTEKGLRRCANTMARSRKPTTGMSSPPVARGATPREDDERLDGADLAAPVRPAQIERDGGRGQRRHAERR